MATEIETLIKQNLPELIRQDPEIRAWVIDLTRQHYADRLETESRFDRMMEELRKDREEQTRKWDEQSKRWDEQDKRWGEQSKKWDEQSKRWDEQSKKWDEQSKRWDEQDKRWGEQSKKWDEQDKRWQESSRQFQAMHEEIMKIAQKHDRSIGALGSRWGIQTEKAFRDALAAILEQSFNVRVLNINEYDDSGEVFGRPEQIELDVIIKNGMLIICEIKSSIDKAGMYMFERKARFYEKHHQRKASRLLVVSPMIDKRAQTVAKELGIETYGDSEDVKEL